METSLSWTFAANAHPRSPFYFRDKCAFCEWDYVGGVCYGYMQLKEVGFPPSWGYETTWQSAPIQFMNSDHDLMLFSFGSPLRPTVMKQRSYEVVDYDDPDKQAALTKYIENSRRSRFYEKKINKKRYLKQLKSIPVVKKVKYEVILPIIQSEKSINRLSLAIGGQIECNDPPRTICCSDYTCSKHISAKKERRKK